MVLRWLALVLVPTVLQILPCQGKTQEMTITVPAGGEECFFEAVNEGQVLDVDYQASIAFALAPVLSHLLPSPSRSWTAGGRTSWTSTSAS